MAGRNLHVVVLPLVLLASGCGREPSPFDGDYVLDAEATFGPPSEHEPQDAKAVKSLVQMYSPLTVRGDVIRYGEAVIGEFRLTETTVKDNVLTGEAIWHEDAYDPGDMATVVIRLEKRGSKLHLSYRLVADKEGGMATLVYEEKSP